MSTREDYFEVFDVYLPVAGAVFALVCGAIAVAVWRGRRRTADPSTRKNNLRLEAGYAVVLALVTAALLTLTLRVNGRETRADAAGRAERVVVVAAKWNWRFEYPRYGIVEQGTDERPAELVVPRGVPVAFRGRSRDVIHALWVPSQRFQRQLFNDRVSDWRMTFTRDSQGETAPCAFYCGFGHRLMRFRIRVLDPAAFRAWVRERRA